MNDIWAKASSLTPRNSGKKEKETLSEIDLLALSGHVVSTGGSRSEMDLLTALCFHQEEQVFLLAFTSERWILGANK